GTCACCATTSTFSLCGDQSYNSDWSRSNHSSRYFASVELVNTKSHFCLHKNPSSLLANTRVSSVLPFIVAAATFQSVTKPSSSTVSGSTQTPTPSNGSTGGAEGSKLDSSKKLASGSAA